MNYLKIFNVIFIKYENVETLKIVLISINKYKTHTLSQFLITMENYEKFYKNMESHKILIIKDIDYQKY